MTDDALPLDANDTTRTAIERILPKLVTEIEGIVEGGGKKTVAHLCEACGTRSKVEVQVADADMLVRALPALSGALQRIQSKDDPLTTRATKILSDRSDLSDVQLAEYIASLEVSLAAEED